METILKTGPFQGDGIVTARRQPRQSREELRELLIQTGRAILREEGLGTGAFDAHFQEGLRSRGGGDRNPTHQCLGHSESRGEPGGISDHVLVAIALDENEEEVDFIVRAVGPVLATVNLTSPDFRKEAMREVCRVGGPSPVDADQVNARQH